MYAFAGIFKVQPLYQPLHRRAGRVDFVALALHHMPFKPAGIAREPCTQNLVGLLHALQRVPRRGGRKKGLRPVAGLPMAAQESGW